ncbi:MAG TPA: hypothetical protein VMG12_44685, partial [Polyangiaceae bacterium]|nr:hypothetical protein [Polyangiaceae bacterium]
GYEVRLNPGEIEAGTLPQELYRTEAGGWDFRARTEGDLPVIRNHPYRKDIELDATLPTDLKGNSKLRKKFEELLAARDKALRARNQAEKGLPKPPPRSNEKAYNKWRERPDVNEHFRLANEVTVKSRELGTVAAEVQVRSEWPDAKLLYPKDGASRSGDFDLVFEVAPNQYVVVEAKGGGGQLTTRRVSPTHRAMQGTREYYDSIITSMLAMGGDAQKAAALLQAAGRKNVTYLHVQLPLSTQGSGNAIKTVVEGIEVNAFNISKPGLRPVVEPPPPKAKKKP